jgi:hypothetical protein
VLNEQCRAHGWSPWDSRAENATDLDIGKTYREVFSRIGGIQIEMGLLNTERAGLRLFLIASELTRQEFLSMVNFQAKQ